MGLKMKSFVIVLCGFMLFLLTGCDTITYYADYQLSLDRVEHPKNVPNIYGVQKIDTLMGNSKYNYCFEDSLVRILWLADSKQIIFSIENKTDNTIKIHWDDAAFVDENNHNHRVIHSGVKYNNRANPQPPSVIVRRGIFEDFVFPTDYIQFVPGNDKTEPYWIEQTFFMYSEKHDITEQTTPETNDKFKAAADENIGKLCQVLLPMQIDSTVHEYIFTFRVANVTYGIRR
jgi:hypothetical protein